MPVLKRHSKRLHGFFKRQDSVLLWALLIGFLVRVYAFGDIPPGLNQDEASTAYDAFSLLKFGVDRNGFVNPVVLVSWGSGMYALASYVQIPFFALFGVSVFVARLPFLMAGVLSLWLFYILLRDTTNQLTARIGVLLLAIAPWHIMISRWGLDSNLYPFVFLAATVCAVRSVKNPKLLYLSVFLYGLTLYSYGTAYMATPVFLVLLFVYGWFHRKWKLKTMAIALGVFVAVAIPVGLFLFINSADLPSIRTPILSIPRLTGVPRFQSMGNTDVLSGEFYTHAQENIGTAWRLFWTQNDGLIWNAIPLYGILYLFSSVLAVFGFVLLCAQNFKKKFEPSFILIAWCVASIGLAAYVSININRANIAMLPFIYCVAVAVAFLWKSRPLAFITSVLFVFSFVGFTSAYFGPYRDEAASSFFASFGDAIKEAAHQTEGPICITGDVNMPYIFILFYLKEDPREFMKTVVYENPGAEFQGVSSFGRFTFGLDRCSGNAEVLVVTNDEASRFDPDLYEETQFERYTVLRRQPPPPSS